NVGCIGMVRKEKIVHSRVGGVGDYFILAGGRTGRDGIHGVNFASADLTEESEERDVGAVQLGDPIVKEPLMHSVLEINEEGLITGMKDLGGGGLSCVSGEMVLSAGLGAEIELDRVLLKEPDMAPWEIWVSESQERMMVTAKEKNVKRVLEIFSKWDVEATVVGRVVEGKRIKVYWKGKKILDMDLLFQTEGPLYCRPYLAVFRQREVRKDDVSMPEDLTEVFFKMISDPNVASKEWIVRQYDHEVRGRTVIKPLQGDVVQVTHGDATVLKPLEDSYRGLALTTDVNPYFTEMDPYWGAASAVDEAVRNLLSVGARPHSFNDCLNFGNPEKPERLGDLREAARGMAYVARAIGVPFVSGNVSLYNESEAGAVPPTPTIFAVGIVEDIRKATTVDLKKEGSALYLIGRTDKEMGGSLYYRVLGSRAGVVPKVDVELLRRSINAMLELNQKGVILSSHDLAEGGIAVALAEMAFGGGMGAEVDLAGINGLRSDIKLFSESNTRWIIEVPEGMEEVAEEVLGRHNVPWVKLGRVGGGSIIFREGKRTLLQAPVEDLRERWRESIYRLMGVVE
ncbi:MAG: phosphoribosylformylglycinamidine synthase subunit PurL, partial [Thermoplasmata archaeon]|nr:phosphoribosylformylglycinamidine synthase subunit PurL [Thermoplasmata archaeon]